MFIPNINFSKMPPSYLFSEVARRVSAYRSHHPSVDIIRMDIGDVSLPLPEPVVHAMTKAVADMGTYAGFHGYGPEQGYGFLREKIAEADYAARGITHITPEDIFISDGAKSDCGNLGDLFGHNVRIAVADPVYPVYVDANVIDGRAGTLEHGRWSNITYLPGSFDNGFLPPLPAEDAASGSPAPDVIYLCSPGNPTGAAMTVSQLKEWVDYALRHRSLIIFDSAYEAYVTEEGVARSIYEVEGAERCAIEVRSFSKTAGFTGVRCGYTVVPATLTYPGEDGEEMSLQKMWLRRQCTKFNGVGYIVQRGAEALYTPEGQKAVRRHIDAYMANAKALRASLLKHGCQVTGGVNSPYVWFKPQSDLDSWQLFDLLLDRLHLTSTPGAGFGEAGNGCIRFTGFNTSDNTQEAIRRISDLWPI